MKGFTGVISDLGGPTANMYRIGCKSREIEPPAASRAASTRHLPQPQHRPRSAGACTARRAIPGVKKILIGSGLRYDLAVRSPEYVKELVPTTWAVT